MENICKADISRISWATRNSFPKGYKFISAHAIVNSLKEPVDFDVIAEKCSVNPNHEHFGKSPDVIKELWKAKGAKGAKGGNDLDTYITELLHTGSVDVPVHEDCTEETLARFNSFKEFYAHALKNLSYIGSEIWLTSKLGISCRLDALFQYYAKSLSIDALLVFDWKSHKTISSYSKYHKKLRGPLAHLDECELNTMTVQLYVYQYILEEYGFNVGSVRIGQLTQTKTVPIKPAFPYDKQLMEDIIKFAIDSRK